MTEEQHFRVGACHSAQWLRKEALKMAADGKTSEHLSAVLGDLLQVLMDWREGQVDIPEGNPWEWKKDVLTHFIALRKSEW